MGTLFSELLAVINENAKRWQDAAQQCEAIAKVVQDDQRSKLTLITATFEERAKLQQNLAAKACKKLPAW